MSLDPSFQILPLALKAHLLVVTDSLAQPGLQLFQALLQRHCRRSITRGKAAVLCLQNDPTKICSPLVQPNELQVFDAFHPNPQDTFQEAASYKHLASPELLVNQLDDQTEMLFIDSLSELATRSSVREAMLFLRHCYASHPQLRIACLVSADLDSEPSLLTAITTLPLARTFCKLSIHPTNLLNALRVVYNLNAESPALHTFMSRFQQRGWAGHGFRSEEADEVEMQSVTDALGSGGQAVLQWELRGHDLLRLLGAVTPLGNERSSAPVKSGEGTNKVESIKRGLNALVQEDSDILDTAPIGQITKDFVSVSKKLQSQDPSVESISATLPFNLSLTEAQRAEKESTILPFHREAGAAGAEAIIHYEADSADDIDEEEGDED